VRFVFHHLLTVKTPMGRKARAKMRTGASPLVRVKPKDLVNAGIAQVPRVTGVRHGLPVFEDDSTRNVKNVIWCTGYHHGFPWIDLPIFDDHGDPVHDGGVVPAAPGLYFVGLHFLFAMSSGTLMGVARDAERIVKAVASKTTVRRWRRARVPPDRKWPDCMNDTVTEPLILDLLEWVSGKSERTYEEVMDAWRTSCPRLPVWEDANDRGLVATESANGRQIVRVTAAGRELLAQRRPVQSATLP